MMTSGCGVDHKRHAVCHGTKEKYIRPDNSIDPFRFIAITVLVNSIKPYISNSDCPTMSDTQRLATLDVSILPLQIATFK